MNKWEDLKTFLCDRRNRCLLAADRAHIHNGLCADNEAVLRDEADIILSVFEKMLNLDTKEAELREAYAKWQAEDRNPNNWDFGPCCSECGCERGHKVLCTQRQWNGHKGFPA